MKPNSVLIVWLATTFFTNFIAPLANLMFLVVFLFIWYTRLPQHFRRFFS